MRRVYARHDGSYAFHDSDGVGPERLEVLQRKIKFGFGGVVRKSYMNPEFDYVVMDVEGQEIILVWDCGEESTEVRAGNMAANAVLTKISQALY